MNQELVQKLVDEAIAENDSLFLIDLNISTSNKINVIVDGDQGVPLNECIRISRHVEHNLDREEEDFALEVSTPDITRAITHLRQYYKNVGRTLKVKTEEGEVEGVLTKATDNDIELHWKTREPKPIGKGKVTVEKSATLTYQEIKEAKVKIIF